MYSQHTHTQLKLTALLDRQRGFEIVLGGLTNVLFV